MEIANRDKKDSQRKRKTYLRLTVVLSILFGIILPVTLGVRDIYAIALIFSIIWFVYSAVLFAYVFLVEGRIKDKAMNQ